MAYDAFISYSQAADGRLAPRLQSALHRIAKPWYKLKSLKVYRDSTNLALTPNLWDSIERAIEASNFFIFLASPTAAASRWVRKEIDYWLKEKDKKGQRLLIVLTEGTLTWDHGTNDFDWDRTTALPRELGRVFAGEPLWLDLCWAKHGSQVSGHDPRLKEGAATIAAALTGKSKDQLIGEDVRQRRFMVSTVAAVIIALSAAIGVALWQWNKASLRAIEAWSLAQAANAVSALADGRPDRAVELALQANDIEAPPSQTVQALADVAYNVAGTRHVFSGHTGEVSRACLVPGGRYAATGSADKTVRLWDIKNGKLVRTYSGHTAPVTDIAVNHDGMRLLSAAADGRMCLWEIDTDLTPLCFGGQGDTVTRVAFIPHSSQAISGHQDGGLAVWDLQRGAVDHRLAGHKGKVLSLAVDPSGRRAASGSSDDRVCIWDLDTGAQRCCSEPQIDLGPTWGLTDLAFHPDGGSVLVGFGGYPDGVSIALIEAESCKVQNKFRGHEGGMTMVAFGPDGRLALSGTRDRDLVLWDVEGGRELQRFRGHRNAITSVAFSTDGQVMLSGSADRTARLWSLTSGAEERRFLASAGGWIAVSDSGRFAVSLDKDHRGLQLWELTESQRDLKHERTSFGIISAAVSNDGKRVLVGSLEGDVWLWLPVTGELHRFAEGHLNRVTRVLFGPGEKQALSGAYPHQPGVPGQAQDRLLILWNLESGQMIREFIGHKGVIQDLALSRDGSVVLSGSTDGTLRMWDVASGRERLCFEGHEGDVFAVAISSDASRVASGSRDLSVRIWEGSTGKELRRLMGHTGSVRSVAFGPNGERLLSGSDDATVRLWDVATGEQVGRFQGHTAGVRYVAFRQQRDVGLSHSHASSSNILKDNMLRWWRLEPPIRLTEWVCGNRFTGGFRCP
jgi:WD40 repeat protein